MKTMITLLMLALVGCGPTGPRRSGEYRTLSECLYRAGCIKVIHNSGYESTVVDTAGNIYTVWNLQGPDVKKGDVFCPDFNTQP